MLSQIILATITPHDYFFFASKEYGAVATSTDYIGNYALMYAINVIQKSIHRAYSGTKPHYAEDFQQIEIYSTPATLLSKSRHARMRVNLGDVQIPWNERTLTKISQNTIGESLTFGMKRIRENIPQIVEYYKHPPLNTFYTYFLGGKSPSVIRLGKKYSPCRVHQKILQDLTLESGTFRPDHPITVTDLPPETELIEGAWLYSRPTPLLLDATLKGEYYVAKDGKHVHRIAKPFEAKYPLVFAKNE